MKRLLIALLCAMPLYASDYEAKPSPEQQLQLIIHDKNMLSEDFKRYIEQRPNLVGITITGHRMTYMPILNIPLNGLQALDLSNGQLTDSSTLPRILKIASQLRVCRVAQNNLQALWGEDDNELPNHDSLTELDCSGNHITTVDFIALRKKLPKLTTLNLSGCPLREFNIEEFEANSVVPTIYLNKTQLPDTAKKEILKHAQETCVTEDSSTRFKVCTLSGAILTAAAVTAPIPLILNSPLGIAIPLMVINTVGAPIFGCGIAYLATLGCTAPKDRFKTSYIASMDNTEHFTEKEITTWFDRFVRNFPYLCDIFKRCKSQNAEYTHLKQVEEGL